MRRINSDKWISRFTTIGIPIIIFLVVAMFTILNGNSQRAKRYAEEQAKAQQLIEKRIAESNGQKQVLPVDHPVDHHTEHPTNKPTYNDSPTNMTDQNNRQQAIYYSPNELNIITYRYEDGIYKGMTYSEARTAWKKKRDEIVNKRSACSTINRELAKALVDSSKAERSLILTFFKSMSPEELEFAKTETLKEYPDKSDQIENFFNKVENHDTIKSLDDIFKDAEFIVESDEAIMTASRINSTKFDKLTEQINQVYTEKPILPNVFK